VTEKKTLEFYPWGEGAAQGAMGPDPARKNIAPYWKDLPLYHGPGDEERVKNGTADRGNVYLGLKHCMPYFDAMIMGYHYLLHTDINIIRKDDGTIDIKWDSPMHPVASRGLFEMPVPHGHYHSHWSWQMYWGVQPPEGYGVLLTHPLNRYDLPFTTVAGYVDYDVYPLPGNVSFHIKDNFEGVIPAGTPLMSMIPIKRESWVGEENRSQDFFRPKTELAAKKETVNIAHYKKNYRVGPDYN
jgi:hypothetical protein